MWTYLRDPPLQEVKNKRILKVQPSTCDMSVTSPERPSFLQQELQVCLRTKLWIASSPRLAGPNAISPEELQQEQTSLRSRVNKCICTFPILVNIFKHL